MKKSLFYFFLLGTCFSNNTILYSQDIGLDWAVKLGGSISTDGAVGYNIAVDDSGNTYTTGVFYGTVDFDPGSGSSELTAAGSGDLFISKFDLNGNFIWAKRIGGIGHDIGSSILVNNSGNVYITGYFKDIVDFDPGNGTVNLTSQAEADGFALKLDVNGNFIWAKRWGGFDNDDGISISLDASGNLYVIGSFWETVDFDPGSGTVNITSAGDSDAYLLKLDPNGNFVWVKTFGGSTTDFAAPFVLVDPFGNIYCTGHFTGTIDFNPGAATFNISSIGPDIDAFVLKLDPNGDFLWAKAMGGTNVESVTSISVDVSGNVYMLGFFFGTSDLHPGTGVDNHTSAGSGDVFISKLDSNGDFVWAKRIGGTGLDRGFSITTDQNGNVYATGSFSETADFDPGAGIFNLTYLGFYDFFVLRLDAAGNFLWAKSIGGTGWDAGNDIAVDGSGNVYMTGFFRETVDFDPGAGVFNLTSPGDVGDGYILKLKDISLGLGAMEQVSLNIYPNPANEKLLVETEENMQIQLINIYGAIVQSIVLNPGTNEINIDQLASGVYFMVSNSLVVKTFVKQSAP
ncbi:MAG: SBBP repeat-containing protein [Fluviicola sp.]